MITWCGRFSGRLIRWIWTAFYGAYREDGPGRPAYDPSMMA